MAQDVLSSRPLVVPKPKAVAPKPSKKRKREEKDPRQNKGGNYLRSTRAFASGGAKMASRVTAAFEELSIPDTTMTTARVSKGLFLFLFLFLFFVLFYSFWFCLLQNNLFIQS